MHIKTFSLSVLTLAALSGCQLAPEQQNLALQYPKRTQFKQFKPQLTH